MNNLKLIKFSNKYLNTYQKKSILEKWVIKRKPLARQMKMTFRINFSKLKIKIKKQNINQIYHKIIECLKLF